jgi:hypothetical protein
VQLYGVYRTPERVACETIYPMVARSMETHIVYDAFAGDGDLIFGLMRWLPDADARARWFGAHAFLYDVRPEAVEHMRERAIALGVPKDIARERIRVRDTLAKPPQHGENAIHITNPPWFYKGSLAKRPDAKDTWAHYFQHTSYVDVYQLAMGNDIRLGVREAVYIVPPNFLFGDAVASTIRREVFRYYTVPTIVYYAHPIFETTDQHALVVHMKRKPNPDDEPQEVELVYREPHRVLRYRERLSVANGYRAGAAFDEYVGDANRLAPHTVRWYLTWDEVLRRRGNNTVRLLEVSVYGIATADIDDELLAELRANPYFLRTLDSTNGRRAGLYRVQDEYGVEGIVAQRTHRTHPIQVRVYPPLPESYWDTVAEAFNATLERLRTQTRDGFMTCFRYGYSPRRYLGLNQAARLLKRTIFECLTQAYSASAR